MKKNKETESDFWSIKKELKLIKNITPVNIDEEKYSFLKNYNNKIYTNPTFVYEEKDNSKHVLTLEKLLTAFEEREDYIGKSYAELCKNTIDWIKLFQKRDKNRFGSYLTKLYGIPNKTLISKAVETLFTCPEEEKESLEYSAKELKAIISKHNKSIGLSDWKISIENMTAKMSVNNILKKIKIKSESKFGRKEIERLKVHEIGTHVRRYENGKIQGNKIFQSGFPNYLSTEEGLAIYSEHKTELISNRTIRKYALRVLVAAYANKVDFYKLFDYTNNFIDDDEAFSMIVRIKRGLSDTSQLGGYTKDQVYLKGFIEVSKLSSSDIKKLFIGKIGIDELQYFNILETNSNVDYPSWLKQ